MRPICACLAAVMLLGGCALAKEGLPSGRDSGRRRPDASPRDASTPDASEDASSVGDAALAPPDSCAEILARDPSAADGEHVIVVGGVERTVYCDMTSDGGGWTRAVDLDPTAGCPAMWDFDAVSEGCWIDRPDCAGEIRSFFVDPPIARWSELRGFVRGYQFQTPDGFDRDATSLDEHYVDGVSITTGTPRRHLWTLGVGLYQPTWMSGNTCPCDNGPPAPAFVGDQWTCETGNDATTFVNMPIWYLDDLLWDGDAHVAGCAPADDWFVSRLGAPSEEPIEVRLMLDQCDDNVAITALRLFVR